MARFGLSFLIFLPLGLRLVAADCYFPNGDEGDNLVSCQARTEAQNTQNVTSVCCPENFPCLTNGLCLDNRYNDYERVVRGGCTDQTWGSSCLDFCTLEWPTGDEQVFYCGNGKWCCSSMDCCEKEENLMDLGEPEVGAFAKVQSTSKGSATSTRPPTSTQTGNPDQTQGGVESNTAEGSASRGGGGGGGISTGAGIGIGIGIAGALFISIFGIWYCLRQRRKIRELKQAETARSRPYEEVYAHRAEPEYTVELEGSQVAGSRWVPEMGGTSYEPKEMPNGGGVGGVEWPKEVDGKDRRIGEMDGGPEYSREKK